MGIFLELSCYFFEFLILQCFNFLLTNPNVELALLHILFI